MVSSLQTFFDGPRTAKQQNSLDEVSFWILRVIEVQSTEPAPSIVSLEDLDLLLELQPSFRYWLESRNRRAKLVMRDAHIYLQIGPRSTS